MSSELVLFQAVPAGAIETIFDGENKPWFKRADLGRYLGIVDIARNFKDIKTTSRQKIPRQGPPLPQSGMRGGGQNSHDTFVNLDSALEIAVRSNKPKAVELVKWLAKKGVEKLQEEHQHDIKEHQRAIKERENVIEEKDAVIALLYDDLEDVGKQLVDLEHENHELQNEVERLRERYVPYLQDIRKDNGMVIVQKNNGDEYPYVAICGQ